MAYESKLIKKGIFSRDLSLGQLTDEKTYNEQITVGAWRQASSHAPGSSFLQREPTMAPSVPAKLLSALMTDAAPYQGVQAVQSCGKTKMMFSKAKSVFIVLSSSTFKIIHFNSTSSSCI